MLHDRWSASVHLAMPEIAHCDEPFHRCLVALIEGRDPSARIAAAERIFERLFGER